MGTLSRAKFVIVTRTIATNKLVTTDSAIVPTVIPTTASSIINQMIPMLYSAKFALGQVARMVKMPNLNHAFWEKKVASMEKLQLNTHLGIRPLSYQDLVLFMEIIILQ